MKRITLILLILCFLKNVTLANEVNVFSARHYDSDIQLYNKFTSQTGIKVNVISGNDKSLQKRIIEEGKNSKADLYITADAGTLGLFDLKGMFQNSMSPAIKSVVPANFRSKNWTGISKRARIIYYSPERVSANDLNGMTYEALANPKWKGRIVIRQSNNIYNQSLVASLIDNNGKESATIWVENLVKNM
ncbi:ABC transporter substrate-binding protein, partial [Candidatus Pelagibacter ubique]|nr:ABC transporter substrate-binding protein [Candidatus Pelagibacter ubique]